MRKLTAKDILLGAVVVVVAVSILWARMVSQVNPLVDRLELVWPNVPGMVHKDRRFLKQLALQCGLSNTPLERKAVVDCLRDGAAVLDQLAGNQGITWTSKLKELLRTSA